MLPPAVKIITQHSSANVGAAKTSGAGSSSLSKPTGGEIAGIVIGTVGAIATIVGVYITWKIWKEKKEQKENSRRKSGSADHPWDLRGNRHDALSGDSINLE